MRIRISRADVDRIIDGLEDIPEQTMREAGKYFKSITPIRSGNARRKTKTSGTVIDADYAYADRLDNGWSRQAPNGMTDPTIDFIEQEINKRIRRL